MPKVLNKRTDLIPPDAVLVDRTTKWGNPFKVGSKLNESGEICTREKAILLYRFRLESMKAMREDGGIPIPPLDLELDELRGKDLVCWCHNWDGNGANPMYCHADVLLELANE